MKEENIHTITIAGQALISPNKFIIKFNCVSADLMNRSFIQVENLLSKEALTQILNDIEEVKVIDLPKDLLDDKVEKHLNQVYAEVLTIRSFQTLKEELACKIPFEVVKYEVENFEEHEIELIEKLIGDAKRKVLEIIEKDGKALGEMLSYQEISKSKSRKDGKPKRGFALLKEEFIEDNYKGYLINGKGEVVLNKRLMVFFEIYRNTLQ
jgi:hypothetical protein